MTPAPTFFADAAAFRRWLERHHGDAREVWVGFYKKDSGIRGMSYREALDEALCYGWVDGLKKRVDAVSYMHRFSPRTPNSNWSAANVRHVERLTREGRMAPAGLTAWHRRDRSKPPDSRARRPRDLPPGLERRFRAARAAWAFFQRQPAGYRRLAIGWVMGAKRDDTRARRLGQLLAASTAGERLPQIEGRPVKKSVRRRKR